MTEYKPAETLIGRTVLGAAAASISFQSIPQTYEHLRLTLMGRSDRPASGRDDVRVQFNNDGSALYSYERIIFANATVTAAGQGAQNNIFTGRMTAANSPADSAGEVEMLIPNYARAVYHKTLQFLSGNSESDVAAGQTMVIGVGRWGSAAAINRIDLYPAVGPNFLANTVACLYGVRGA